MVKSFIKIFLYFFWLLIYMTNAPFVTYNNGLKLFKWIVFIQK